MKVIDQKTSNSHYKNQFFENPPPAGFQKIDFGISKAFGFGNTKICIKIAVKTQRIKVALALPLFFGF
ncbi:MAG: hypothetical protein ACK5AW_07705 [Pseudanabaena sp.]